MDEVQEGLLFLFTGACDQLFGLIDDDQKVRITRATVEDLPDEFDRPAGRATRSLDPKKAQVRHDGNEVVESA